MPRMRTEMVAFALPACEGTFCKKFLPCPRPQVRRSATDRLVTYQPESSRIARLMFVSAECSSYEGHDISFLATCGDTWTSSDIGASYMFGKTLKMDSPHTLDCTSTIT